jgi:hypothetical protein
MMKYSYKLRTLLVFVLLNLNLCLLAQFSSGGRIGVNLSNLRGSSVHNSSMLVGYSIGPYFNYKMEEMIDSDFGEILSIQSELTVELKGGSVDYILPTAEGLFDTSNVKQNFTYVQVPLLAKFTFGDRRYGPMYYGEGGFYGAALFGLTVDGEKRYDHDNDPNTDRRTFRDDFAGFDFGTIIGGGVIVPFGGRRSPWEFYGNLRYCLGLSNIAEPKHETPEEIHTYHKEVKTSTISLLAGIIYKF